MTFRPVEERIALRRELEKKFEEVQGVIGTDNDLIQIEYLVGGNRRTYTGRLIDHDEENLIFDDKGKRSYVPKNFIDTKSWRTVKKEDLIGVSGF